MLAPLELPDKYVKWNSKHGAPFGYDIQLKWLKRKILSYEAYEKSRGPFAIQSNNTTRTFEYPWAFEVSGLQKGMNVLELGGGLSGLQFILSQYGCHVVNVDPGLEAKGVGFLCDQAGIIKLNKRFNTHIELKNTTINKANLADNSFDICISISAIEHFDSNELNDVMQNVYRCLKPGGLFILTIDLFLNIYPFCSRISNEYGTNLNIKSFIETCDWDVLLGKKSELYGYDEFNVDCIVSNLDKYLIGKYPVLVQCLILKKCNHE